MSDALRKYTIETVIDDQATDTLESILATAETLVANSYEILVGADTEAAQQQIENVRSSVSSLTGSYDTMAQAMSSGQAPRMTAKEIESLGWATEDAEKKTSAFRETLSQLSDTAENVASGATRMVEALSGVAMLGAAGVLGGIVEGAVEEHKAIEDQMTYLRQTLGERSGIIEQWAEQGDEIYGSSKKSRMATVSTLMQRGFSDPEQMIQMASAASTIADSAEGRQNGITSASDLIEKVSSGRVPRSLQGMMPGLFDSDTLKATGIDDERQARMALMPDALKGAAAKVTPDTDGYYASIREMEKQTGKSQENLGGLFEPLVKGVNDAISTIESLANMNPAVSMLAGTFLTLSIVAGATAGVFTLASIAAEVMTGALLSEAAAAEFAAGNMGILNAVMAINPAVLIIVGILALGAALVLLESKTHALSGAWEVFSKSQIGQDMIGSVQALLGAMGQFGGDVFSGAIASATNLQQFIGDLFQTVDGLYKYLKETGNLDIVMAFAFGGPVGAMYEVMKDSYKSFMDFYDFIRGVWSDITDLPGRIAEAIKNVPQEIFNAATGSGANPETEAKKLGNQIANDENRPGADASNEEIAAYAKKRARELYDPEGKTYSDAQLQPIANDIYNYVKAIGTQDEQHYKDNLNTKTPVIPIARVDEIKATTAGEKIVATATNNYGQTGVYKMFVYLVGASLFL